MQASNLASQECFDCEKLIQALKDDDTSQIEQQRKLIGSMLVYRHSATIPFEMALGEAILNSDLKFAEKMANFVVTTLKSASPYCKCKIYQGADDLPFWSQFIVFAMTDRYYNRLEHTSFFRGLVKLLKDRVFDPWQCMNSAEAFIKMIRLGLGSDPTLRFTEKGESMTYYVVTTNKLNVQNKRHILRFMEHRKLLDLNAYNGHPSPAIAVITLRLTSIWNNILCRYLEAYKVHDEHGNNVMYYALKHKVNFKRIILRQDTITIVQALCEKNKEGKAMIEYSIVNNKYPDWFFNRGWRGYHILAYHVHQELARNNEIEVLQRLPPIPDQWLYLYSYLFTMYDFPHNKPSNQHLKTYTGAKRKNISKDNFVGGSNTSTFTFEQLPIEIFEIILMELDPTDVVCLKMTSKLVDMAFNRTSYLSKFFRSLCTTLVYSPSLEFSRQVKLGVNWKRQKYRMHEIPGIPYNPFHSVMDDHWLFTTGANDQWLCNLHTDKVFASKAFGFPNMAILLESGPVNAPIVAAFGQKNLVLTKYTLGGDITTYKVANLETSFKYSNSVKIEQPYIRQLMGKRIVLGRDGAIWNYEVDATVGHLLDPMSDIFMCDVHANESKIVAATNVGLSLYDHRTFNRITNITENDPNLSLRVFLHNNEVVQVTDSGIKYYDVRTHRLLETMPFIEPAAERRAECYVFDTHGARCVVNYPPDSFNIIYNIRERGWESALMTHIYDEVYALNSYAMLMNYRTLTIFS